MATSRMKVGMRLGTGFAAVLVLMLMISGLGTWRMHQVEERLETIVNQNVYKLELIQTMSESVHIVSRVLRTVVLLNDQTVIDRELAKIEAARKAYDDAVAALEKTKASEAGKALRARIRDALQIARPLNQKIVELAKQDKDAEAIDLLLKDAGTATAKWQDALHENIKLQEESNRKDAEEARTAYESAIVTMLLLSIVSVIVAIGAAIVITRGILRQLGGEPDHAAEIVKAIAGGNLTIDIPLRAGDTSSLIYAMQGMRDSLNTIVAAVRQGTDAIATASSQIAAGNLDLSSRTEQQASSLGETATSMEELTSTVKQNADNARQANSLALTASEVAVQGGTVVAQVVDTMGSINDSARKIVDIIGVIDGIAFQTNILALNAAVEAARAGEQGRGFAVVASEVRSLAQRSASAAKEIKTLIGDSVEKVDAGTRLVDQAGATMQEIVGSIRRVTDIMGEITSASQEQTAGIEQVSMAVSQMDEVTQQNAALVEQASAAAQSLQDQAGHLAQSVSVFKLQETQSNPVFKAPVITSHPASGSALTVKRTASAVTARPSLAKKKVTDTTAHPDDDWEAF